LLARNIGNPDGRIRMDAAPLMTEFARLRDRPQASAEFPLRMIGMRETRSHNSWLHNVPRLVANRRSPGLRIHPADARGAGVAHGGLVRVTSNIGHVDVVATVTDQMIPGTVALPHGWGHVGGWNVAARAGGVNSNMLASCRDEDIEPLAGMTRLNGIPVRVEPAPCGDYRTMVG